MAHKVFTLTTELPAPADQAFAWHQRPGAFERLIPPWQRVQVLKRSGSIHDRGRITLRVHAHPWPTTWELEHHDYIPGKQFADRQITGPFAFWNHRHLFETIDEQRCRLTDHIEYALPGGALGRVLAGRMIHRRLARAFAYRHRVLAADLQAHRAAHQALGKSVTIALTGSHGLIGSSLMPLLTTGGHHVIPIVRHAPSPGAQTIQWDPNRGTIDADALAGVDAVIHLAGEPIMGRWSQTKKKRIRDSRVNSTRLLAETLAKLDDKPFALVCASAVGYFGDRGDEILTEQSHPGSDFLAQLCQQWEAAVAPAVDAGIRVVHTRFGLVLSPKGGALKQMLPLFRLGLGGTLGAGDQYWPWICLNDATAVLYYALYHHALTGPVNVVSPQPVSNRQFTRTLGRVLRRPTLLPVPRLAARIAIGQFADQGLFASQRVVPQKLIDQGYAFGNTQLEPALRQMLGIGQGTSK